MEEIQLKLNKSSLSGKKNGLKRNERAVERVKLLGNKLVVVKEKAKAFCLREGSAIRMGIGQRRTLRVTAASRCICSRKGDEQQCSQADGEGVRSMSGLAGQEGCSCTGMHIWHLPRRDGGRFDFSHGFEGI